MQKVDLANEWLLLQNQFDSYEKFSLIIKLVSIGLLAYAGFSDNMNPLVCLLLFVLWLQDAIWKTYQSRIEHRLLLVENFLSNPQELENTDGSAYQFNRLYIKNKSSSIMLFVEYFRQAVRPTVAFPYVVLLAILGFELL